MFIVLLSSLVSLCSYFIGKSSLSRVPLESGCIATPDSLVGLVRLLVYTCIVYLCLGFLFFGGYIASLLIPCFSPLFGFVGVFLFFWPMVFSFSASRFPGFYVWLTPRSTCFGRTFLRWFVAEGYLGPAHCCPAKSGSAPRLLLRVWPLFVFLDSWSFSLGHFTFLLFSLWTGRGYASSHHCQRWGRP